MCDQRRAAGHDPPDVYFVAMADDYYRTLGVSRTASDDEIRKAYRELARKYHPDVSDAPDAADRFSEITEAYEVLSDPEKRRQYDQFGRVGPDPRTGGGGTGWSTRPGGAAPNVDLNSIFEEMFGGAGTAGRPGSPFGGGGSAGRTASARGRDITHEITVSFVTAAQGGTEQLRLTVGGTTRVIDVKIPAGIGDGAKLRIRGEGHPGLGGAAAGDLIVTVSTGQHPWFRREGLDLLVDIPVSFSEAALGVTVAVPLLSGTAEVKIPAGASSGQKLRLRGQGIQASDGRSGDYFAVVQIVSPQPLTDRARALLEELSPELNNPRESAPWADKRTTGAPR